MEAGEGCSSEIEIQDADRVSHDQPVTKKPKLLSRQDEDEDQDLSDESMSEDESYVSSDDDYDYTSHIPIDQITSFWFVRFAFNILLTLFFRFIRYSEQKPLQWEEKCINSGPDLGPELNEIKRKIEVLKSKGFNGISFTAKCISDAYKCLHIFSDPRGLKIRFASHEDSYKPESDVAYLQLLKKYRDSGKIREDKAVKWQLTDVWKLQEGFNLCNQDMSRSLEDFLVISAHVEVVEQWLDVRGVLLDPKSKEEYCKDPETFLQNLKMKYGLIRRGHWLRDVLNIVVKWWEDDSSGEIRESARSLIDDACKAAIYRHNNKLDVWWTKADYVKLKLDVASLVGIYKNIPDEIADFVLPGHFKWSLKEKRFVFGAGDYCPDLYKAVKS